jgi:hypothetical protein
VEADKKPVSIYLSYSLEDERFAQELLKHFYPLRRERHIEILNRAIKPGSSWSLEQDNNLNQANLILLLISPDFLASDYLYSIELRRALERRQAHEAYVLPILVRPCDWQDGPLTYLQILPSNGTPVTIWTDRDRAFLDIVRNVRSLVVRLEEEPLLVPSVREVTPEQVIQALPKDDLKALAQGDPDPLRDALEAYKWRTGGERLILHDGGEFVYYDDLSSVMVVWQIWQTLITALAGRQSGAVLPLFLTLAEIFSRALSSQPSAPLRQSSVPDFFVTTLDTRHAFGNLEMPGQIPLIFYAGPFLAAKHTTKLRQLLGEIGLKSRMGIMVLFMEPKAIYQSQQLLKEFQRTDACDIIPLECGEFLKIIEAREPVRALRRWLLSQAGLSVISPFQTNAPTSNRMFFGREQELRTIRDHAQTASYALVGGRRIGKTSILRQLEREDLPGMGLRVISLNCDLVYCLGDLIQAISLNKTCFPVPPVKPFVSLDSLFQALPQDQPIMLLLDEADKLVPGEKQAGYPLLNALRALANAGRCQFVFAGEYALLRNMEDPYSPLFNFANKMLVGYLDKRAASQLVREPMHELEIELKDEQAIVQRIVSFTAGHPNVIQRLCDRLIKQMNREQRRFLSEEDVERILADNEFLEKDFLHTYWSQATRLERICTLVMARDRSLHTLVEIHAELIQRLPGITLSVVKESLESLIDLRNLIRSTKQGYVFAVEGFPVAFERTHVLDDVLAVECERYRLGIEPEPPYTGTNSPSSSIQIKKKGLRTLWSGIFVNTKKNTRME